MKNQRLSVKRRCNPWQSHCANRQSCAGATAERETEFGCTPPPPRLSSRALFTPFKTPNHSKTWAVIGNSACARPCRVSGSGNARHAREMAREGAGVGVRTAGQPPACGPPRPPQRPGRVGNRCVMFPLMRKRAHVPQTGVDRREMAPTVPHAGRSRPVRPAGCDESAVTRSTCPTS